MAIQNRKTEAPPLGVKPYWLWVQTRVSDLADAISRYSNYGTCIDDHSATVIKRWSQEIAMHCDDILSGKVPEKAREYTPSELPKYDIFHPDLGRLEFVMSKPYQPKHGRGLVIFRMPRFDATEGNSPFSDGG